MDHANAGTTTGGPAPSPIMPRIREREMQTKAILLASCIVLLELARLMLLKK